MKSMKAGKKTANKNKTERKTTRATTEGKKVKKKKAKKKVKVKKKQDVEINSEVSTVVQNDAYEPTMCEKILAMWSKYPGWSARKIGRELEISYQKLYFKTNLL